LVTTTVKDSRDQELLVVPIVDDVALDDERPNAFAELRPTATHARLFDEQLESITDGANRRSAVAGLASSARQDQISSRSCSARADSR
jgi:hypothetical protein